jgi:hypothetical protein
MLCQRTGAVLKPIPLTQELTFDMEAYLRILSPRTRLVAAPYVSNALGIINPVPQIIEAAKRNNPSTLVLVDGAQSTAHMAVDVQALGCDFYVFSGHKVYAPTGTGVLWGRESLLEQLPPWQGGGEMIKEVYGNIDQKVVSSFEELKIDYVYKEEINVLNENEYNFVCEINDNYDNTIYFYYNLNEEQTHLDGVVFNHSYADYTIFSVKVEMDFKEVDGKVHLV